MTATLIDLDGFDHPFEIVDAVFRTRHQTVAQQIVHAVGIELRRHDLSKRDILKVAPNDRRNSFGKAARVLAQQTADGGLAAQNSFDRKRFVMKAENRFDDVRKRPMPDVVEQRGGANCRPVFVRYLVFFSQPLKYPRSKMQRSETMRKPRMFRRLISKIRQPQLPDPPQSLKLRRVDQRNQQPPLVGSGIDTNYIMNRVTIDPLRHK